jgi:tetratricopeptide (TPR) repeat protein
MREWHIVSALALQALALLVLAPVAPADAQSAADLSDTCISLYDKGDLPGAIRACDEAIIADPGDAASYYFKGSALYHSGKTVDGKFTLPDLTGVTLRRYLELAPDGPYAKDTQDMLRVLDLAAEARPN